MTFVRVLFNQWSLCVIVSSSLIWCGSEAGVSTGGASWWHSITQQQAGCAISSCDPTHAVGELWPCTVCRAQHLSQHTDQQHCKSSHTPYALLLHGWGAVTLLLWISPVVGCVGVCVPWQASHQLTACTPTAQHCASSFVNSFDGLDCFADQQSASQQRAHH